MAYLAVMLAIAGGLAVLLASMGVYGVIAFVVMERGSVKSFSHFFF